MVGFPTRMLGIVVAQLATMSHQDATRASPQARAAPTDGAQPLFCGARDEKCDADIGRERLDPRRAYAGDECCDERAALEVAIVDGDDDTRAAIVVNFVFQATPNV